MKRSFNIVRCAAAGFGLLLLTGCFESPPMETVQRGYRGTGMEQVINPDLLAEKVAANLPPETQPVMPLPGPKSSELYKNVQVLGDTSAGELAGLMVAMTEWVSPEQGCNYCHVADMASDELYTKRVARTMISMTQNINQSWGKHVQPAGVTCYTCHRGNNIPEYVWAEDPGPKHAARITDPGQNTVSLTAAYSSLPYDPLTTFLQDDAEIRMASATALPTGNRQSIKQTEWTYSLMMHFSESLGVGCVHCHNSRAFASWSESPPTRVTAWHGIRMVRDINNSYISPINDDMPANRKGPLGDALKANCKTCHQGAYKPFYGAPQIENFPSLGYTHSAVVMPSEMESDESDSEPMNTSDEEDVTEASLTTENDSSRVMVAG